MDASSAPGTASHSSGTPGQISVEPDRPTTGRRTSLTLLVLVFVGFISLGLTDGLLGVAWPSIRQTFGLPLDALGVLFLTTVCGYMAASIASGWVVQRIGVGMLLALSALAAATSLLTFALAPTWGLIVVAGILAGLGGGAIDAGLNSYVALAHSPRLLSWLHACFGVGAATGPAIMLAVLNAGEPWRLGYAIVGGGQLALGACFLLTRRQWQVTPTEATPTRRPLGSQPLEAGADETAPHHPAAAAPGEASEVPPSPGAPSNHGSEGVPGREGGAGPSLPALVPAASEQASRTVVSSPGRGAPPGDQSILHWPFAVWLSIVLFLVYTGIETAAGQWAYTLFVEGRGIAAEAAGLGVSAYWGALAIGRVLAGLVANRITPAALTRWSMVGMLAGAILLWLNAAVWLSFAGLVLMGLAAAPVFPSLIGVTPLRFGASRAATIIGFQVGAASLGIAGLPALSGVLAARVGLEVIPLLLVAASAGMVALHEAVVRQRARPAH